jgi:transcription antitermination factor NusG
MTQPYLVVKQEKNHSRNSGRPYTKITLQGIKDRQMYETYIEVGMRNYKNWSHIVENTDHVFVLNNLTVKKTNLIDADSTPVIEHSASSENAEDILQPIEEFWAEELERSQATTFNRLFKVGK